MNGRKIGKRDRWIDEWKEGRKEESKQYFEGLTSRTLQAPMTRPRLLPSGAETLLNAPKCRES